MSVRFPPVLLAPDVLVQAAEMIRVLGHPVRLRLVEALERGPRTVSDLVAAVAMPQAIVSQQLAKLRAAGIVRPRREGCNVWYHVADARVLRMLACLRQCDPPAPRLGRSRAARAAEVV
jgi:ArsR family transcriptional regulator